MRRASWAKKILWAALGLFLLVWAVPTLLRVNYWQEEITASLSQVFGRPVRAGNIHPRLWGGVGFEIENVVLEEDPPFGIEPFVRMESLQATVALRSLWRNRVEFSRLVFVRPSLNVVRNAAGEWNLGSLGGSPGKSTGPARNIPIGEFSARGESLRPEWPQIRVESGRINFKWENQKKATMIESLDFELLPPDSPQQPWEFSFEGTPNRTDAPVRSASRLQGRGVIGPFASSTDHETETPLRLDWSAEDALVSDLLATVLGEDFGVHGTVHLQGRLAGTTSLLRLSGKAELRGLHRWDLLPPPVASAIPAEVAGILDLDSDSLQLTSLSFPLGEGAVMVQGRIEELTRHPRSALQAELRQVSLAALAEIARQFTTRLDSRFVAQGSLSGRVQTEGLAGNWLGALEVSDGLFRDPESSETARFSSFRILLDGRTVRLGPLEASLGQGSPLQLSLEWDLSKPSTTVHLQGENISLPSFQHWAQTLGTEWGQASFSQGALAVRLDVSRQAAELPQARGWARISDAALSAPGVNQPLRVPAAQLQFQRGQVRVRPFSAALGSMEFRGSLVATLPVAQLPTESAPIGPLHSMEFDLESHGIDLAEMADLFDPPRRGLSWLWFAKDRPSPVSFLTSLATRGTLRADRIHFGGFGIENAKASLDYRDRRLEIADYSGVFAGGAQSGSAVIRFGADPPSFALEIHSTNADLQELTQAAASWKNLFSGKLSGDLRLASAGRSWSEILEQLSGSGEITGQQLTLHGLDLAGSSQNASGSQTPIASFSSKFQIAQQQVHITEMSVIPASSVKARSGTLPDLPLLAVTGAVGFDRRLNLVVQQEPEGSETQWAGTIDAPRVVESNTPAPRARRNASLLPK